MDVVIRQIARLPRRQLLELTAESELFGFRFLQRLIDDWADGSNRFDKPGEALFAAGRGRQLIGMCGLNIDPYAGDPAVGRLRHLYVLAEYRRQSVGRRLVESVVASARGRFDHLRLRTENLEAALLYERLGFQRSFDTLDCTHCLEVVAYQWLPVAAARAERDDTISAIREGLADKAGGRVKPGRRMLGRPAKKHGIKP